MSFGVIGLLVWSVFSCAQDVDGEALADHLTQWALENTQPASRLRDPFVAHINLKLVAGMSFRRKDDAARVALEAWISSQTDASITPLALYQKAIEIEKGVIFPAMTLVWDVLRDDWGSDGTRNLLERTRKLVDITGAVYEFNGNDLDSVAQRPNPISNFFSHLTGRRFQEIQKTTRGDNFSAWYHFAGTALHAFAVQNSRLQIFPAVISRHFTPALIYLEEKLLFGEFQDKHLRIQNDLEGATFGRRLAENLQRFPTAERFTLQAKDLHKRPHLRKPAVPPVVDPDALLSRADRLNALLDQVRALKKEPIDSAALAEKIETLTPFLNDKNILLRLRAKNEVLRLPIDATPQIRRLRRQITVSELKLPGAETRLRSIFSQEIFDVEDQLQVMEHCPASTKAVLLEELSKRDDLDASFQVFEKALGDDDYSIRLLAMETIAAKPFKSPEQTAAALERGYDFHLKRILEGPSRYAGGLTGWIASGMFSAAILQKMGPSVSFEVLPLWAVSGAAAAIGTQKIRNNTKFDRILFQTIQKFESEHIRNLLEIMSKSPVWTIRRFADRERTRRGWAAPNCQGHFLRRWFFR